MDPNNPSLGVDASVVAVNESYDNSVTSSGYHLPNSVTPSGYPDNGYPDNAAAAAGYLENSVTASGYPDHPVADGGHPEHQPVDVAALMAANNELTAMVNRMQIGYNTEVQTEMQAFRESVKDDFLAVQAQRDAARAHNKALAAQFAATVARLERLEGTPAPSSAHKHTPERTRDPRVRATPSKAHPAKAKSTVKPSAAKQPPATPEPAQKSQPSRRSGTSKDSGPHPSPKPPRSSPNPSRASPNPPRSSPNPSRASANSPASSSNTARSLSSSASSSKDKSGTKATSKNATTKGTPRKLAEHQMLKGDIAIEAQSFKSTFQTHIRFLWGCLNSASAPSSATPGVVQQFERRFQGLTVTELKRKGEIGIPIIDPSQVKVGVSVEDSIRSKNRIVRAFFQLEESAILHVKAYLAKLGIITWAIDFSQSPYSMYNAAMRMCAIDTFRFLIAGTYYDFLHPDTSFIKDSALLVRLYDHFVHRYMFDKWKVEIRMPGSNEINAERNKISQARLRLHASRAAYLKDSKVPKGVQHMFSLKATSDDEITPNGSQAFAREERSQAADQVIRAVEGLMMQELIQDGKTRTANIRGRRQVAAFGNRQPGYFREIHKGMPIQYYDPDWFNNRPPTARAKIAPKLIVAIAPGSTNFFSRRSENALPIEQLTEKYGAAVFSHYDLDFGEADGEPSSKGGDGSADADDEGEGDDIGSEDSEEDAELSDATSMKSFIHDDQGGSDEQDDEMYEEEGTSGEEQDSEQDDIMRGEPDTTSGNEQDGKAQFAAAYDVDMGAIDLERQIFDASDSE